MNKTVLTICAFLLSATPALAEWTRYDWDFVPNPASADQCDKETFERFGGQFVRCTEETAAVEAKRQLALMYLQSWLQTELPGIGRFYSGLGFKQARMSTTGAGGTGGLLMRYFSKGNFSGDLCANLAAAYLVNSAEIEIPDCQFLIPLMNRPDSAPYTEAEQIEFALTLGHELYHAVQAAGPSAAAGNRDASSWINHGMAEAAGVAWVRDSRGTGPFGVTGYLHDYDRSIFDPEPFAGRPQDEDLWHFFYALGQEMGSSPAIDYFDNLEASGSHAGTNGVKWLDDWLTSAHKPLYQALPELVVNRIDQIGFFSDAAQARVEPPWEPAHPDDEGNYKATVQPIAASPYRLRLNFSKSDGKARHRYSVFPVLLLEQEIRAPDGTPHSHEEELWLVVDGSLAFKDTGSGLNTPHQRLVIADPDDTGNYELFNRVVNVARAAPDSALRDVRVEQKLRTIAWNAPQCVQQGKAVRLSYLDGWNLPTGALAGMLAEETIEWRVTGGDVVDGDTPSFQVTAPQGGRLEVTLRVRKDDKSFAETPIVDAQIGNCDIKTTLPEGGAAIYKHAGDYMEVRAPDGGKAYMSVNRVAVNSPSEGGWIPIPASQQAMLTQMMNRDFGRLAEPGLAPWISQPDPGHISRFLYLFGEWYDYEQMAKLILSGEDIGVPGVSVRFTCEAGVDKCRAIEITADGVTALARYDQSFRLIAMDTPEWMFKLERGTFNVALPPGWPATAPRPDAGGGGGGGAPGGGRPDVPPIRPISRSSPSGGGGGSASSSGPVACDCSCSVLPKLAPTQLQLCAIPCATTWGACRP